MSRLPSGFAKRMKEAARQERIREQAPAMLEELKHLVALLEPIENGGLHIPGLATLNKAKAIISAAEGGE